MTPLQQQRIIALSQCSYPCGSGPKRFAREMREKLEADPAKRLSGRQAHYIVLLCWKYRRQISDKKLVPRRKPLDLYSIPRKVKPKPTPKPEPIKEPEQQLCMI